MLGSIFKRIKFFLGLLIKLPLFTFSLFFIAGVVFSSSFSFVRWWQIILLVLFLGILRKFRLVFTILLVFIAVFSGAYRNNSFESNYQSSWIKSLWEREIEIKGTVVREPVVKGSEYQYIVKPDFQKGKDPLSSSGVDFGYILVKLSRFSNYSYGDYLTIYGTMVEPPEFEDFSYKEYLKTQQIFAVVENAGVKKIGERGNFLFRKLYEFKHFLAGNIRSEIPEPHASLLLGILLGIKSGMPESFAENLSRTGTTHIIAVSGYNVTIVLAALTPLQNILGRKKLFWLSIVVLFIFLAIVGFDNSPAVRAGTMGLVYLIAKYSGRRGDVKTIFTFAGALLICINPFIISSISFQLSFVSTLGVIVLSTKIENLSSRLFSLTGSEFAPSLSAIVSTAPITIINFGKISIISLVVNILVLPVVPLLMGLGAVVSLLSLIPNILFKLVGYFVFQVLDYVIKTINWFGSLRFAVVDVPKSNYIPLFIYSLIFLIFLETAYKKYISRYK